MRGQAISWASQHGAPRGITKIRAYALWSLVDAIRMKFGARGLHEVRAKVSPERREQMRSLPSQSGWCEYDLYLDVLESAVERFYGGDLFGAFDLSRAAKQIDAKRMLHEAGIFDSPRALVSQLRSIRNHYLDGGRLESRLVSPSLLRITVSGLPTTSEAAAWDLAGGVAGLLEASGAIHVELVELEIMSRSCVLSLRFEANAPAQGVM